MQSHTSGLSACYLSRTTDVKQNKLERNPGSAVKVALFKQGPRVP